MIPLFIFTARQILSQRRTLAIGALLAFPAAVVMLVRTFADDFSARDAWETFHGAMLFLVLMLILPLVCMLHGNSLIGAEVEQRTFIYLATRRMRRATVLVVRFLASTLVLTALFELAVTALYFCVVSGMVLSHAAPAERGTIAWDAARDLRCYLAIVPFAIAAYLAVFTTFSLTFGRPIAFSITYIALVELVVGNLPLPARVYTLNHQIRATLYRDMPQINRMLEVPPAILADVFPAGGSGAWHLLAVVAVMLTLSSILISFRELAPPRVARE